MLRQILFFSGFISMVFLTTVCEKNRSTKALNLADAEMRQLLGDIEAAFAILQPQVIQPAEGYLKYPYLIPAGFYKQMWDWDGFFMGNHLASIGKPEYLKYWALNLIEGIGFISWNLCVQNMLEGVVENRWMLLEIE